MNHAGKIATSAIVIRSQANEGGRTNAAGKEAKKGGRNEKFTSSQTKTDNGGGGPESGRPDR